MTSWASGSGHRQTAVGFAAVVAAGLIVYWLTAYPTITWWDSSQYSLAAATLGLTTPPGSLLLTLLGWGVTRLPLGLQTAFVLNLCAGALAAVATGLVYLMALRLVRLTSRTDPPLETVGPFTHVGAALGALAFGFGLTLWQHAVKFTPYVLTVVVTATILWVMLRWWEDAERDGAWRWLLVLGVLFGLDFSVHRTNLLLLPALFVWIVLRHPRTLTSGRAWLSGIGGVVVGLAVHLLIMPFAAADPALNAGDPSTWARFWDYVSLSMYGGGFLVQFYPRHAAFWSVQVMDLVRAFGSDFFGVTGPLGPLGLLPGLCGVAGIILLWRRHRRLAGALVAMTIVHAAVTVAYFNIPANFFRPLTRHYLPVFVPFGVAMGVGICLVPAFVAPRAGRHARRAVAGLALLMPLVPAIQLVRHWTAVDGSGQHFTADYAVNVLTSLPANAIVFSNGDNDTWPLLYEQVVEGVRPDVQVVNLSLANVAWYLDQLAERDSTFPLRLTRDERHALSAGPWTDTTLVIAVHGTPEQLGLPPGTVIPDAVTLRATPTVADRFVRTQDRVLLQILRDNQWRRPLFFQVTVSPDNYAWLGPYRRVDGVVARVVPLADPPVDAPTLRTNLLERYTYRGYADEHIRLEDVSRRMAANYYPAFTALGRADPERCQATHEAMVRLLPPDRIWPGQAFEFCRER